MVSEVELAETSSSDSEVFLGEVSANEHKPWTADIIRRIYTTIILGTALLNFGTRVNSFEYGPLYLHGKICSCFFNADFWNGTPETKTAILNL